MQISKARAPVPAIWCVQKALQAMTFEFRFSLADLERSSEHNGLGDELADDPPYLPMKKSGLNRQTESVVPTVRRENATRRGRFGRLAESRLDSIHDGFLRCADTTEAEHTATGFCDGFDVVHDLFFEFFSVSRSQRGRQSPSVIAPCR